MVVHICKTKEGILVPENEWADIICELKGKIDIQVAEKRVESKVVSLLGLGKEIWKGIDPVEYQRKERDSWQ